MTFHRKMFIDGSWTDASNGAVDQVPAPATGEAFAEIAHGTVDDVDRAVAAAHAAFPDWASTPVGERARAFLSSPTGSRTTSAPLPRSNRRTSANRSAWRSRRWR